MMILMKHEGMVKLNKLINTMMKTKAEFAVEILKQYKDEEHTIIRSTNDLSRLEEWLIVRLYDKEPQASKTAEENYSMIKEITDDVIETRAIELFDAGMALEDVPASYTHKEVCLHEAQGYRAGAKATREWYQS
jgi:hypothetical protein